MTKIEWAEESWNPVTGCTPISEGCAHCYAKRMAQRLKGRFGYPEDDPFRVTVHEDKFEDPFKWKKPKSVFVCSMGDLFHDDVHEEGIKELFIIMQNNPEHIYMVLTKRPQRMKAILNWFKYSIPPQSIFHIWLGVTAENQTHLYRRVSILAQIPAAKRFVSLEPLLGPVDLYVPYGQGVGDLLIDNLDWVIVGGESGPGARPMHPNWVRSVRDQCQEAGVPFFFKQWGEWMPRLLMQPTGVTHKGDWGTLDIEGNWFRQTTPWNGMQGDDSETREYIIYKVGKKKAGRLLDGREWNERP